jgi:hypothetical protein
MKPDSRRKLNATVKGQINEGVLSEVATRLNRGVPTSMPAGVVLSVRGVRGTTRPADPASEPVIGVRAALGAFGGVLNKFPENTPNPNPNPRPCFIATAALDPFAPDVVCLRTWRDRRLVHSRWGGRVLLAVYERWSPPLARLISRSERRRSVVRVLIVAPAARFARWSLRGE